MPRLAELCCLSCLIWGTGVKRGAQRGWWFGRRAAVPPALETVLSDEGRRAEEQERRLLLEPSVTHRVLGPGRVFKSGSENVLLGCGRAVAFIDARTAAHRVEVTSPQPLNP